MIFQFLKKRLPLIIFLIIYIALSFFTYKSYGITNDEPEEYFLGKLLYIKLVANDPGLEKNFVIDDGKSPNLLRYDRIYPAFLYSLNNSESYELYHLLNLLFATSIFIFSYEVFLKCSKNSLLALIGPMFILLTPRFFGHIAANPKDVPFAIFYFVSISLIFLLKNHKEPISLLLLGLSFGFTQSLRMIGYSIYLVYFLYSLFYKDQKISIKSLLELITETIIIFLIGFLIHILTLPYLGADPLNNFNYLIKSGVYFPWNGKILFESEILNADNLPWYYLPKWILITTPLSILVLLFHNLILLKKQTKIEKLIWISIFVNLLIFFILKPRIYDGLRHMLFLLPMISSLAGLSLIRIIKEKNTIFLFLIFLNLLFVIFNLIRLFPYQYTYFNELVFGINGANHKYEIEYWGASYKEAISWLNNNLDKNKTNKIYICGDPNQLTTYAESHIILSESLENADVIVCHKRADNQKVLDKFQNSLFKVERMGVVFNEIKTN